MSRRPAGPPRGHNRPTRAKPGETRTHRERRERFERARREALRGGGAADHDGPVILYGWHTVKAPVQNPGSRRTGCFRSSGVRCRWLAGESSTLILPLLLVLDVTRKYPHPFMLRIIQRLGAELHHLRAIFLSQTLLQRGKIRAKTATTHRR